MDHLDLQSLNDRFGIAGQISFTAGPGDLPRVAIRNTHASALVALQGGQVMAYQPQGEDPVLWLSSRSVYAAGKAIRGGIPICWPWFGPHPEDAQKPQHGFARTALWHVLEARMVEHDATELRLGLSDTEATRQLWPHPFELELAVTVGPELGIALTAHNRGNDEIRCTSALHSYFQVSAVETITIRGLDGRAYLDKVEGMRRKVQHGSIVISGETDRIYLDTPDECVIEDPGMARRIHIAKEGSRSTVVWNPWVEKARQLPDFGDEEYHGMVCVETANAGEDAITIRPGGAHTLAATLRVERDAGG